MAKFNIHTLKTAPRESAQLLERSRKAFGVPSLYGVIAEARALPMAYEKLHKLFSQKTSFDKDLSVAGRVTAKTTAGTAGLECCSHSLAELDDKPSDHQRRAWMAAAQAGDLYAYKCVLEDSIELIRSVARGRGVPRDSLDDVVQETLLTVHRMRRTYDSSRSYDSWLATLARRRAIDALRRYRRHCREVSNDVVINQLAAQGDASAVSEYAQLVRSARATVSQLTPCQREAVEILVLNEQSLAEASARTGRSIVALKVNLHRALKVMRKRLARNG